MDSKQDRKTNIKEGGHTYTIEGLKMYNNRWISVYHGGVVMMPKTKESKTIVSNVPDNYKEFAKNRQPFEPRITDKNESIYTSLLGEMKDLVVKVDPDILFYYLNNQEAWREIMGERIALGQQFS